MSYTAYINRFGKTVKKRTYTEGSKNAYGAKTKTFSETNIKMAIRQTNPFSPTGRERMTNEGIIKVCDAIGTTTESIDSNDQIIDGNITYEVDNIISTVFGNSVFLRKVN